MKRYLVVPVLMVLAIILTSTALADRPNVDSKPKFEPVPISCTVQGLRPFSEAVWDRDNWKRGMPSQSALNAYQRRLGCAPRAHKKAMKNKWRSDKKSYFKFRNQELFRVNVTPYRCGSTNWATECTIPEHESGYGSGGTNLYGMKDAWAEHGCTVFAPTADTASKRDQDICAHRHWSEYGRSGWPSY